MIKGILLSKTNYRLIRVCLSIVFIWAGLGKFLDISSFSAIISEYALVPEGLLAPIAIAIPIIELGAGFALLFDVPYSLELVTFLIIFFIAVLWFGILMDLDIDCGCFSLGDLKEHATLREALLRDLVFLLLSSYLFLWRYFHNRDKVKSGYNIENNQEF